MVDVTATGNRIEERSDLGEGEDADWQYWADQEKIAENQERNWRYRSRAIVRRYRDDRGDGTGVNTVGTGVHRYNILWSNVQTLMPTLYARTPEADVRRRFNDQDDVGRLASILLERALEYSMEQCAFDDVMLACVEDRLLPGRGVARVLYIPHFGDELPPEENEEWAATGEQGSEIDNPGDKGPNDKEGDEQVEPPDPNAETFPTTNDPLREVVFEEALLTYIFWEDYLEGPARTWREVPWVRYRSYMTREELVARFGDDIGHQIELDYSANTQQETSKDKPPSDIYKKAVVHETWDKDKKQVIWWCPGTPDLICDQVDDPLQLRGFFANPDPLLATKTNDKRIPVPDYLEYQDQARELDTLTARIDRLTRAMKVSGVYAGAEKQVLQQLIDEGTENRLIPVEDWQAFATEKGGLKGIIEWVPIEQVAGVLIQLYNARDRVKQIIYEITGISDIMRGASSPQETFGAQQIKANFGTLRTAPQQKAVAKFAGDAIRLMGELIAQNFSDKTISLITGYPQLQPVPQVPQKPMPPLMPLPMQGMGGAPMALPPPGQPGISPQPPMQAAPLPAPPPVPPVPGAPPGTVVPIHPGAPMPPQAPPPPSPQMIAFQKAMAVWQQANAKAQAVVQQNATNTAAFQAATALLRKDALEGFRIDVESDSTAAPDEMAEKAARTEFLAQFVPFMEQMVPLAQGSPTMSAVAKEFALFAIRGFKVARTLEETVEKAFDALATMPPQPPKGRGATSPQEIAAQVHDTQTRAATDTHDTDAEAATKRLDIATRAATARADQELEAQTTAIHAQQERERLALEQQQFEDQRAFRQLRGSAALASATRGLT